MFVGIDDTDSLKGMCTTYLAALLVEKLKVRGLPRLVRLNPNIPYKTRGNGAVFLDVGGDPVEIRETVLGLVEEYAHLVEEGTNPGVVFVEGLDSTQKRILGRFYMRALSELVSLEEAEEVAGRVGAEVHRFKNGRGVVGALAAVGSRLPDRTYELIAYRLRKNYGRVKGINEKSVFDMHESTYPGTFDSVDLESGQVLITPKGYDPVFCGIRGNSVEVVERAWGMVEALEDLERVVVFESNQGTDAHLRPKRVSGLRPYDCAILQGRVTLGPQTIAGGHVIFGFSDGGGEIACAAYEPTGGFREAVRGLVKGDRVVVFGGVGRYPNTLNLEKIRVVKLERVYEKIPPQCCNRKMTSAGSGKGFKCRKCGGRRGEDASVLREILRGVGLGFYEVPPRARRHLSKPLVRS